MASSRLHRATLAAAGEDADQYLDGLWNELKKTERDIVVQENIKGTNQNDVTKHLIEEMLETALEHVKTKERAEAKHAKEMHDAFEHAVQDEKELAAFVKEEHLRDVAMDGFVRERFHTAQQEESQAVKEEGDAVRAYKYYKSVEDKVKATLEAFKRLEP